jgi:hypothetical protein
MSEHQWREKQVRAFLAERDGLFRNPTLDGALAYWKDHDFPPPVDPSVPLATVHKARLHWLDATDAMLRESQEWLLANGYETTIKGVPPLTPETRDAERRSHGVPPLRID